jgi:hypothetical protein
MPDQLYKSFLLRLWPSHGVDGIVWCASLEDAHTGTRTGFSSIERLHEFLLNHTKVTPNQPHPDSSTNLSSTPQTDLVL